MSSPSAVLHLAAAPRTEPAATGRDWDEVAPASSSPSSPYVQGSLAVDFGHECTDAYFGPQATGTADLPDAQTWARRIVQAVLETYDGSRDAAQLARWVTPQIRERAQRRGQLARRRGRRAFRPPLIRTMRTCFPADGICEVAAVVQIDGRVRALALRLSGVDRRWLVTAWELG